MKYVLMMNTMKAADCGMANCRGRISRLPSHTGTASIKELAEAGEFVVVQGLTFPDEARLVRAGKDGTPITDSVFPKSKEFLAGYWIVDVESRERVCFRYRTRA